MNLPSVIVPYKLHKVEGSNKQSNDIVIKKLSFPCKHWSKFLSRKDTRVCPSPSLHLFAALMLHHPLLNSRQDFVPALEHYFKHLRLNKHNRCSLFQQQSTVCIRFIMFEDMVHGIKKKAFGKRDKRWLDNLMLVQLLKQSFYRMLGNTFVSKAVRRNLAQQGLFSMNNC